LNPRGEGKQISVEFIRELREIEGVAGIHVMAYHQEHTVAEIIERTGVLEGEFAHIRSVVRDKNACALALIEKPPAYRASYATMSF